MRFLGFIGPSYKLNSVNVDCQRCVNLYPELNELGTGKEREVAALVGTPGLRLLQTVGSGPIRGSYTASTGTLFVVSRNKLYSVSSSWVATELGTLNSVSGLVSIADNGLHLVVVDGTDGYVWTFASSSFAEITDSDFPGATQVTYQDGYFIFFLAGLGQFFISGLNAVTFDALDIASAEGAPDDIIAIISDHRDLWLFGQTTTEVWYNSGAADFPFDRTQGAFIEHGCAAAFSVAKMNNTVFWLGRDDKGAGMVFMASGYQPQRISTHAIEQAIQGYDDVSGARAYTYQQNGHHFYVLNFPGAETSWAFDSSTNLWHERAYTNQGQFERHRADNHAFAYDTHVVGDYENGKIYALDSAYYSDNGSEITRMRISPHSTSGLKLLTCNSFQLDMEVGTGLDGIAQGTDPQVMLQWSNDGGHTWSNERWVSFGKIGQKKVRALWRRLGMYRDRVYKLKSTDPVKTVFIGAEMDVVQGVS